MNNHAKGPDDTTVTSTRNDGNAAINRRALLVGSSSLVAAATLTSQAVAQAQKAAPAAPAAAPAASGAGRKPNILVIFGDDIGIPQISAYTMGMMGYRTPNIDRIAREGAIFTDAYGQQSCTAGRASFILGQEPFRTGLLTIGMPGDPHGIPDWMPTIADALKTQGYATGQFGKNHLGDRDEHLPTKHGFDEFFGNLYHLNAEEEPEGYFYPKDPEFPKDSTALVASSSHPRMARSKTPVRSTPRACRRSTRSSSAPPRISSTARPRRTSRSSSGSTRRACTSSRI